MFNKGQQYQQHHQQQMKTAADGKADGATDLNKLIAQLNLNDELRSNFKAELVKLNRGLQELNLIENHFKNLIESHFKNPVERRLENFEELDQLLTRWEVAIETIVKNREDLIKSINLTVIQPLRNLRICFTEYSNSIKRLEQLEKDFEIYTTKARKYSQLERNERNPTNIMKRTKYEALLREAQQNRDDMKAQLEKELPRFLHGTFYESSQPSITALICAHILYSGNNLDAFKEFADHPDHSSAGNQDKLDALFASIDQLTIVTPP